MIISRDITIFKKNNDIDIIKDIQSYDIYFKANKLTITTKDKQINYVISDLSQIIIDTIKDKKIVVNNDTIIF